VRKDTAAPPDGGFEAAWALGGAIPGWLTRDQARLLWDRAVRLPAGGTVLEIGSHQGRSTLVLARAARRAGARVVAVDPFVDGRLFGGAATRSRFEDNVARSGVADVVELRARPSTELRVEWSDPLDLLFVDGKHDYWTVSDDLRWAEHLPPGGDVLLHDAFSSVGVTAGVLRHVLPSRRLAYAGRVGSLALLRVAPPSWRDRGRLVAQLPWFARNLLVKVGLRLLRPVCRVTGRPVPPDPY
jgi:predicted O-methyltransferase YrrM